MSDNNILQYSECLITSCDYRVRYVPHPNEKESAESPPSKEKQGAGFRLWSTGPNFDTELPQDVTGIVGHTAYLTCRVFDRTNSTVSTKHLRKEYLLFVFLKLLQLACSFLKGGFLNNHGLIHQEINTRKNIAPFLWHYDNIFVFVLNLWK